MLGYRSYFHVTGVLDNQPLTPAALAQVHSWLREKRYDADGLQVGRTVNLAAGVEGTLTELSEKDGSHSTMFLMQEHGDGGVWTSRLIVHEPGPGHREPWVWLDIDAPDQPDDGAGRARRTFAGRPRLAKHLLDVIDGRDGGARLDPKVGLTTVDDVEAVVDALRNPARRGLVFVAGSDDTLPMAPWSELVGGLLGETTGLAAGFVLDAEATRKFAGLVGSTHAVAAGTMRTYARGVEPGVPVDGLRHRWLSTAQIVQGRAAAVKRVLGERARDVALAQPLPRAALRVEEAVLARADSDFFAEQKVAVTAGSRHEVDLRVVTEEPQERAEETRLATTVKARVVSSVEDLSPGAPELVPGEQQSADIEIYLALAAAVTAVLGTSEVTAATVGQLEERALEARSLESALRRKQDQLSEVTDVAARLRETNAENVARLEDEQLEHAATSDDAASSATLVKVLRQRLQQQGRAEEAWTPPEPDEGVEDAPQRFTDLLERIADLHAVVWTGDDKATTELDVLDPLGLWARKTWRALLALQDYATEASAGRATNVESYLSSTPAHLNGFPGTRHATDESDSVKNNPKYCRSRMLVVPQSVADNGVVFMGAHFKIAQSGRVAPRMHYFDNTTADGKIYVGYIGRHLPNGQTN